MTEQTNFVDYYELLGIATDAEPTQIRLAFIRLAKQHHPDVGGTTSDMQQFTKAYRTLMSESARRAYDRLHDFHTGNAKTQYRDYGTTQGTSVDNLSDDEIDDFLNAIFAEYNDRPKPKKSLLTKLLDMF